MDGQTTDSEQQPDWRLHATGTVAKPVVLPWNGQLVTPGTVFTVVTTADLPSNVELTVSLPSATALFFNIAHRSCLQARDIADRYDLRKSTGRKRKVTLPESDAFAYFELMLESVVAAHTAIEAYANEMVPVDFKYEYKKPGSKIIQVLAKADIERQISLCEKLASVLPAAYSVPKPTNMRGWADYKNLKKIRDRIIHMKAVDRKSSGPGVDTIWHALLTTKPPPILARPVLEYFAERCNPKPTWYRRLPE